MTTDKRKENAERAKRIVNTALDALAAALERGHSEFAEVGPNVEPDISESKTATDGLWEPVVPLSTQRTA